MRKQAEASTAGPFSQWGLVMCSCLLSFTLATISARADATVATPQSPPSPPPCNGEVPSDIVGTWHGDMERTLKEGFAPGARVPPNLRAVPMTFTEDTLRMEFPGEVTLERSFTLVGGSANRYDLEVRDAKGATVPMTVFLVPCGIATESTQDSSCLGDFCRNAYEELQRKHGAAMDTGPRSSEVTPPASDSTRPATPQRLFYFPAPPE